MQIQMAERYKSRRIIFSLALSAFLLPGCLSANAAETNADFVPPEITLPMPARPAAVALPPASAVPPSGNGGYVPGQVNMGSAAAGFAPGAANIPGMNNPNQPNPFMMKAVDRMRLPPGTKIPTWGSGAPGGSGSIPGYPQAGSGMQGGPPMGSSAFMQPGQQPPAPGTPLQKQLAAQAQAQGQAQGQVQGQIVGQTNGDPVVTVQTSKGNITIRLFKQVAPITCKAFLEMVKSGFYNGLTFHRVEAGFVVQGGCPNGDGTGNYVPPGQTAPRFLPLETSPMASHNAPGVVAMARQPNNRDSASCQFYITLGPKRQLDGQYTVFGGVVAGMDVVQRIAKGDRIIAISADQ